MPDHWHTNTFGSGKLKVDGLCGQSYVGLNAYEPRHEISNNMVCATSKASDQPAHTPSLIKAFASRLNIL